MTGDLESSWNVGSCCWLSKPISCPPILLKFNTYICYCQKSLRFQRLNPINSQITSSRHFPQYLTFLYCCCNARWMVLFIHLIVFWIASHEICNYKCKNKNKMQMELIYMTAHHLNLRLLNKMSIFHQPKHDVGQSHLASAFFLRWLRSSCKRVKRDTQIETENMLFVAGFDLSPEKSPHGVHTLVSLVCKQTMIYFWTAWILFLLIDLTAATMEGAQMTSGRFLDKGRSHIQYGSLPFSVLWKGYCAVDDV